MKEMSVYITANNDSCSWCCQYAQIGYYSLKYILVDVFLQCHKTHIWLLYAGSWAFGARILVSWLICSGLSTSLPNCQFVMVLRGRREAACLSEWNDAHLHTHFKYSIWSLKKKSLHLQMCLNRSFPGNKVAAFRYLNTFFPNVISPLIFEEHLMICGNQNTYKGLGRGATGAWSITSSNGLQQDPEELLWSLVESTCVGLIQSALEFNLHKQH